MDNMKYIGSWANNPNEDVDIETALADLRLILLRPDEYEEETYFNAIDTIQARFGLNREAIGERL